MCNFDLKPLIERFKEHDMTVFSVIYDEFKGLIIHYGKKLNFDDAIEELNLFFIELLYGIDLSKFALDASFEIQRYMAVSIRNKYIYLSGRNDKYEKMFVGLYEEWVGSAVDFEERLVLNDALGSLPERQRIILVYKYIYLYSDLEIARLFHISRQAVNRLKNRGLASLRTFFDDIKKEREMNS